MDIIASYQEFILTPLSEKLAEKYAKDIILSLDQIPLTDTHTAEKILSEKKGERVLYAKWEHSVIALDNKSNFAGVIIGYERVSEGNEQYPSNSIYLNDLAVSTQYQKRGLGKFLVQEWIAFNKQVGFKKLHGDLRFSVQTNKAEWNNHVQKLYEAVGFKKIAEKKYDNRTDNVYSVNV